MDIVWHTYTGGQLAMLRSALQTLIDGKLLDENEKGTARGLIVKLSRAKVGKQGYATVIPADEEEEELLSSVGAALWTK